MDDAADSLRFKELTLENWNVPDPLLGAFGVLANQDNQIRKVTESDLVAGVLKPQLNADVPYEIRRLFEVARGAFFYGWFFYPLYALGFEQVYRVLESAVSVKCDQLEMPREKDGREPTYAKKIRWLMDRDVISPARKDQWKAFRELRNMASHPRDQTILPPSLVLDHLHRVASEINEMLSR